MPYTIPFNDDWLYAPSDLPGSAPDDQFTPVTLPHTNITLPYHNFDNYEYQFISTYRKRFTLPEPLNGRRLYVEFDGAMTSTQVSINGHVLGEHDGGYVPFAFNLTDHLRDGENVLQVRLDSTERPDVPPNGGVVDYLTFGGIYRDVRLEYVADVYIDYVFVKTYDVLTDSPRVEVDVRLKNDGTTARECRLEVEQVLQMDGHPQHYRDITLAAGEEKQITVSFKPFVNPQTLWTLENPVLSKIGVRVVDSKTSEVFEATAVKFGFRDAVFKDDGFYLNGKHLKLIGLNRHQTFPYIGGAAPERLQRKDADILKYELGINIVRTSHYPQSPHFLNRCDEIGLLVMEEIPGWQFIGDSDWKALSLRDVEAMITRDRNHPSIVLWGVRINESQDDDAFYRATNKLAHELDPTRQTGGVRFFQDSHFLEDVFTYNDFSNTIVEPKQTPHLVTEFNGHMYPTKTVDQEERQIEHALRHARVQNAQMGNPRVSGAIGWCAFDYNTHREFGSGDRICYHGVMDIFRLPKFAAEVYRAQGVKEPFVSVVSFFTHGDRSTGGNNPLHVLSNCDEIEVFVGTQSFGRHTPDRETFPHLPHPPFKVPGLTSPAVWAATYVDLHVIGYKGGQAVAEQYVEAGTIPRQLILRADDEQLHADGADMTRLSFKIADKYGNRLPFAFAPIHFEIDGPGELIGQNPFPLAGGQGALYLKATKQSGIVTVRATTPRLAPVEVKVTIG